MAIRLPSGLGSCVQEEDRTSDASDSVEIWLTAYRWENATRPCCFLLVSSLPPTLPHLHPLCMALGERAHVSFCSPTNHLSVPSHSPSLIVNALPAPVSLFLVVYSCFQTKSQLHVSIEISLKSVRENIPLLNTHSWGGVYYILPCLMLRSLASSTVVPVLNPVLELDEALRSRQELYGRATILSQKTPQQELCLLLLRKCPKQRMIRMKRTWK